MNNVSLYTENELRGLDTQAKDTIERIQTVARKLGEDNVLLVEKVHQIGAQPLAFL